MFWKDYMYFTRSERNGIKVLLLLILLVLFIPSVYRLVIPLPKPDISGYEQAIIDFEQRLARQRTAASKEQHSPTAITTITPAEEVVTIHPFPFDPNNFPESGWQELGLPDYVIRTIKNYEQAGGSFRFREDLQRIYLMKEEWYDVLEPYIELPLRESSAHSGSGIRQGMDRTPARGSPTAETTLADSLSVAGIIPPSETSDAEESQLWIDINKADTLELIQLRGIASVFSRRIVSYRELLGGYLHAGQLLEVYGMDQSRLDMIRENLHFDEGGIRRINLNESDFVTLVRHPYIDRDLANALLSYRDQHHPLDSLEQLRQSYLVTDEVYERIAPYLTVW
jgi:competence protein ComEA